MTATGPRHILITGASSGLGAALATAYAATGVTLHISGRDADRLAATATACRAKGATVHPETVDVADQQAMTAWVEAADDRTPLDLIVANAGVSAGPGDGGRESPETVRRLYAVNVGGVLNTILPVLPRLQNRKAGQIALVSSMAAFRGLPSAPAYSASKGAVRLYGEALRGHLAQDGIRVSVVCPGFFDSRITATNTFPMPMFMSADKAASYVLKGLAKNRSRIAFPGPMYLLALIPVLLPVRLSDWLVGKLPKKG